MEETFLVNKGQAVQYLKEPTSGHRLCKRFLTTFDEFIKVAFHVLKDEVECVILAEEVTQPNHVRMVYCSQRFYFSELHTLLKAVKTLLHLLNGHLSHSSTATEKDIFQPP